MKNPELHKNHRERMRLRFKKNGLSGFEDHEILEMLLFSVIPRRNTNGIAHELLQDFGDIPGVLSADERELCQIDGIGSTVAGQLLFLGELFSEVSAKLFEKLLIDTRDRAGMYAMLRMGLAPAESAVAVYLDGDGIRISEEWLYRGKRKMTDDLVAYILSSAKEAGASRILLMHNHKNEPLTPSPEDITITDHLRNEAKNFEVEDVIHVIVADDGYLHV